MKRLIYSLFLIPSVCFGAVSVTATGSDQVTGLSASTTSKTFTSIVNLPDTTGISLIGISIGNDGNSQRDTTSVTLGGVGATQLAKDRTNGAGWGSVELFYILNSSIGSTGNKDLVVNVAVQSDAWQLSGGVVCFSGQDGTTPLGTAVHANGGDSTPTVGVTDSATGDIVVDAMSTLGSVNSSNQTQKWIENTGVQGGSGAQSTAAGASGTVTMSYDVGDWWAIAAVAVKAASGPVTPTNLFFFSTP